MHAHGEERAVASKWMHRHSRCDCEVRQTYCKQVLKPHNKAANC